MAERVIEPERWQDFCDGYSRQHRGWLVSLATSDDGDCDRALNEPLARELSFEGVHGGGAPGLLVVRLGAGGTHLSHEVSGVEQLISEEGPDGMHQGLRMACADGSTTCLRFRVPAAPETLDGLSEQER